MLQLGQLILAQPGQQSKTIALGKESVTLGRSVTADVVLPDPRVSREHARLECRGATCTLTDLGSANGTWLNGSRVQKATLAFGDVLTLGDCQIRYVPGEAPFEPDVTRLDSEADLDLTLARSTVQMTLADTHLPRLTIHTSARTWEVPLDADTLLIGRDPGADVVLDQAKVSRRHARIERRGQTFLLRDLGSTNGTWLGERRIDEYTLSAGDTLRIGAAQLVFKPGFQPEDLTLLDAPAALARPSRRPVVIVPGLMGSELWRGSERIWPNLRSLFTHTEALSWPGAGPLEARGLLGEVVVVPNLIKLEQYNRLGDYLEEALGYERGRDLLEFAYDWRQDVRISARQLAAAIEQWAPVPPITIIAHSLGCMVTRYYVECLGGKRQAGRLLLVGGPHKGVPKSLTSLYRGLDGIFGLLGDRARALIATFPSTYQILPTYSCAVDDHGQTFDLLADASWLRDPERVLLEQAREFRRELGTRSSVPTVSVFGYGQKTITGLALRSLSGSLQPRVELVTQAQGDGSVPEQSSVLPESEIHPVLQQHGALYVDNDVKMRLKLELARQDGIG